MTSTPVTPLWRRARFALVLALVLVAAGALVAALTHSAARPLDPASAAPDGSRALARVLDRYGVTVQPTRSLDVATAGAQPHAVVVTAPDDYSDAQLHSLRAAAQRLVAVRPGARAAAALAPGLEPAPAEDGSSRPDCPDAGARAAGPLALPADALVYSDATGLQRCYGGVLLTSPRLAVLGSAELLHNERLADTGVAALDINAITGNGSVTTVVWLQPGTDAAGSGPASVGQLFPPGAWRALWWLVAVAVLVVLWRGRRLGGVVLEPLPVVVRAAEVVEGHGRLYRRAGARDRAAAALRTAGTHRLRMALGLPRTADAAQVGVAAARLLARPPAEVLDELDGTVPADDAELVRLAHRLDELEAAVRTAVTQGSDRRERAR